VHGPSPDTRQRPISNRLDYFLAQHIIMPQNRLHSRRRPRFANRCIIFIFHKQQRRHSQQRELVHHRLRENHVRDQRLVPSVPHALGSVVRCHPVPDLICCLLVRPGRSVRARVLLRVHDIYTLVRHADGLPVLEPDGVDHNEARGVRRVHERETRAKHAAHGVSHDDQALNAEGLQQPVGV